MRWREDGEVRWLEAELPGAHAAFIARTGGVSEPPYESLNLAILTGDEIGRVRGNRHRLAAALGLDPNGVLIGRQVHGAEIVRRETAPEPNAYAEPGPRLDGVDGQVTGERGLAPLVFVADCLPVALAGPGGVAMIHCGWRGLAGGIVERGAGEVGATAAAVGPGIGPCCYEVGEEVLQAFEGLGDGIAAGRMLDLREVARRLLARAGIEHVEISELCVSCEADLFFSHRRDGERTGRQAGLAWRA
ncbi:MAG TPA: polyphenol oxidase family protein [Solirubrobacterales bacterium]|nr:polyphenol oxidase family protein [Solirubrobacterales bacterium]